MEGEKKGSDPSLLSGETEGKYLILTGDSAYRTYFRGFSFLRIRDPEQGREFGVNYFLASLR